VLDGDPAPPPKRGAPKFLAHVYCGQTAGWIKLVLGMQVGLSPGDFVLDGDPVLYTKKGAKPPPQFLAHFYCGQTAGCIKMPLGINVGHSPGDFVLDGDPVFPPQQRGGAPCPANFRPISIVPKRLDASRFKMPLGMEVGLIPREFVLDGDPAPVPKSGAEPPPQF